MINRVTDYLKEWGAKVYGKKDEKEFKVKGQNLDHKQVLREMLTVIAVCQMDDELKMILRMRIWGKHSQVFEPMSHIEIALDLGCTVKDVTNMEDDAKYNVEEFLKHHAVAEASEKFYKDKAYKSILSPEKRIIV